MTTPPTTTVPTTTTIPSRGRSNRQKFLRPLFGLLVLLCILAVPILHSSTNRWISTSSSSSASSSASEAEHIMTLPTSTATTSSSSMSSKTTATTTTTISPKPTASFSSTITTKTKTTTVATNSLLDKKMEHDATVATNTEPATSSTSTVTATTTTKTKTNINNNNNNKNNNHFDPNPWFGWQPNSTRSTRRLRQRKMKQMSLSSSSSVHKKCTWHKCFHDNHNITCDIFCRDGVEEWGEAPPEPKPLDENQQQQQQQWIPDVTILKRMYLHGKDHYNKPWPPPLDDNDYDNDLSLCHVPETSESYSWGFQPRQVFEEIPLKAATKTITTPTPKNNVTIPLFHNDNKTLPTVLCMTYTMESAHATKIRAIRETWAPGCDGYLAFSTKSDPRIPAISIPHDGPETYMNMWQKVRSIWKFVGQHYLRQFDYFYIGGDDLYVLPQNLKKYLGTMMTMTVNNTNTTTTTTQQQQQQPDHFLGRRLHGFGAPDNYFNAGGSGYVLSKATLRKLYRRGLDHPKCHPTKTSFKEDVWLAECLRVVFQIGIEDTRDSQQRERFHPFPPEIAYAWQPRKSPEEEGWYEKFHKEWGLKGRAECCAPDSISFHYISTPTMMRHLHKLLYHGDQCGLNYTNIESTTTTTTTKSATTTTTKSATPTLPSTSVAAEQEKETE